MALSDPSPPPSRLTAVLGPPRPRSARSALDLAPRPRDENEPSTVPIPVDDVPGRPERSDLDGGARMDWPQRLVPHRGRLRSLMGRCRPGARGRSRVDPGRLGATALALVAMAAAVLAAAVVWWERPQVQPVGGLPSVTALGDPTAGREGVGADPAAGPAPGSGAAAGPGLAAGAPAGSTMQDRAPTAGAGTAAAPDPPVAPLVVSVSGRVRRPGLVEVPSGARVADALAAAGGALPGTDLTQLNLARRISDGEQVAVGVPPAPDAAPAGGAPGGGPAPAGTPAAPSGRLDLNGATLEQLDGLPGVGPVTAQRILEWRTRNGRFARVEQLREIEGIGERRFGQLRELVTV